MLPRYHILFGILFTLIIWFFARDLSLIYLALILFGAIFIDFDHYMNPVIKNKKISLAHAFDYHKKIQKTEEIEHKKGIRSRGDFHIFHTIEAHILVAVLGFFWAGFFFVFIGMVFHSLIDLGELLQKDRFYRREFFFFNWLRKRI